MRLVVSYPFIKSKIVTHWRVSQLLKTELRSEVSSDSKASISYLILMSVVQWTLLLYKTFFFNACDFNSEA